VELRNEGGGMLIDNLTFGGPAEQAGLDFDWQITGVIVDSDRPPKELMFIPALLLLGGIIVLQRGRRRRAASAAAA